MRVAVKPQRDERHELDLLDQNPRRRRAAGDDVPNRPGHRHRRLVGAAELMDRLPLPEDDDRRHCRDAADEERPGHGSQPPKRRCGRDQDRGGEHQYRIVAVPLEIPRRYHHARDDLLIHQQQRRGGARRGETEQGSVDRHPTLPGHDHGQEQQHRVDHGGCQDGRRRVKQPSRRGPGSLDQPQQTHRRHRHQ